MNLFSNSNKTHPALMLLLGFIAAIFVGAVLLKLPFATTAGFISLTDALFTSASAVCVTGLIVVDTGSYFTIFGQIVILVLIQAGGLGIMTVSVFLFNTLKKSMGISQRQIMQNLYAHTPRKDIHNLLYSIFFFTFIAEATGAVSLFMIFKNAANIPNPLFSSIFHSVSAFCNAGFSLFSDSFVSFGQSPGINITITSLIIFGGLGFPVVFEIFTMAVNKIHGIRNNLSLQSKTVLAATIILIAGGALLFWIIESDNVLQDKPPIFKVFASLFQSVTCRTAGFNTVDIPKLNEAALFLLIMLMFIGASPGSCGGGVKTTTISVVVSYFSSKLRNRSQTALFKRGLTEDIVIKSFTLIVMYFFIISIFTFCISIIESGNMKIIGLRSSPLLSVLFEVVSAIGTVGLSAGITSFLSSISKYLIIILMLTGRVGLLSMAYVIIGIKTQIQKKYAEENIMIG